MRTRKKLVDELRDLALEIIHVKLMAPTGPAELQALLYKSLHKMFEDRERLAYIRGLKRGRARAAERSEA